MKKQKLKQVVEEELQKLLNEKGAQMRSLAGLEASMQQYRARAAEQERMAAEWGLTDEVPAQRPRSEDRVGRQIRVQSTPGTGEETRITSPGSSTISRGAVIPPAISPDSELAAMNPSLAVPSQTFTQEEPMTFNVRRGKSPKEVTIQPRSVRVSGRREPKPGQEHESSWYETYFGPDQQELVGDITQTAGDLARRGYEALGLPQGALSWRERQAQKALVRGAKGTGDWLANQFQYYGQDAETEFDQYIEDNPESLSRKISGLTTSGDYELELGAEGWNQVVNVLDAMASVIPIGWAGRVLRPADVIRLGNDLASGQVDDTLYNTMEMVLKSKGQPAARADIYKGIAKWLDNPYNAMGADELARAQFNYAQSIDPDYDIPLSMSKAEKKGGPLFAGAKDAIEKERIQQRVQGRLDHGEATQLGGSSQHPSGRVPADPPYTVEDVIPGAEKLGDAGAAGKRMSDIRIDPKNGTSGHHGVDEYSRHFNILDQTGDVYLANPYFLQNAKNAARIAKGEAPLPLDPNKVLDQTMNRHQFIRITGRRNGKPDIILNRIITRGPDGKDVVTHSGWMTPNAYKINRQTGMLSGSGAEGLAIADMPVLKPDGSLTAGRAGGVDAAGNRRVLRGPQSYPEAAGGGTMDEPLQERKRHFKLRIKRKR